MRLSPFLLILLLLPTAAAYDPAPILVNEQGPNSQKFPNQNSATYNWVLLNPPFTLNTSSQVIPSTVQNVYLNSEITDYPAIRETTRYAFQYSYNTTETLEVVLQYTRHGWGYLGYWNLRAEVNFNGETTCFQDTQGEWLKYYRNYDRSLSIRPSVGFNWRLIDDADATPTQMVLFIKDNQFNIILERCANSPNRNYQYFNMTEFTANPSLTITHHDGTSVTHNVAWSFRARSNMQEAIQREENQTEADRLLNRCTVALPLLGCMDWVKGVVETAFSWALWLLDIFFSILPFGSIIQDTLAIPLNLFVDTIVFIANIFLGTGSEYGPGGVFFSLLVYASSMGWIASAIHNDRPLLAITFPYYLAWALTVGVWLVFQKVFIEFPMWAAGEIRSWIRG